MEKNSKDSKRKSEWNKTSSNFPVVLPKGKDLLPHQRAAVEYLIKHRQAILGDEQGLGKTIELILAILTLGADVVVIFCPPSLVYAVWFSELKSWASGYHINIVKHSTRPFRIELGAVTLIPYSLAASPCVADAFEAASGLIKGFESVFICDEVQFCKNPKAKRTIAVKKFSKLFKTRWLASGTPLPNRVNDLWSTLDICNPDALAMSHWDFIKRYCVFENTSRGLRIYGSKNQSELSDLLKSHFMLRRTKAQVLKDLPPKVRSTKIVEANLEARRVLSTLKDLNFEVTALLSKESAPGDILATFLKDLAKIKAKLSAEYLADQARVEPLVIFGVHREALEIVQAELMKAGLVVALVNGSTPKETRAEIVAEFQSGTFDVFVGNMVAAGSGFTLTRASRIIFLEWGWSPGDILQAEDRIHRIGQKDFCRIEYLCLEGSFDEVVLDTFHRKMKDINSILT